MGEPVESLISRALVAERADAEMRMRLPTDLIGPGQPLIDYVAGLVSRSEISSLERLYGERTPLHRILDDISGLSQYDEPATVFGAPFWEREKSVVHAARALAAMGLVLVGASENTDIYRMKAALAWYDSAHATQVALSFPWPCDALCGGDRRVERAARLLEKAAGDRLFSGASLAAMLTIRRLAGLETARRNARGLQVLFARGNKGKSARLMVSLADGLPPSLLPDPERMTLFAADKSFQKAFTAAWTRAGAGRIGSAVLWSLEGEEGPIPYVTDESLGAAFAVLLDEIRRLSQRCGGVRTVRRLAGGHAVIGRLADHGDALASVDGYPAKLGAVVSGTTVVVPAVDVGRARQSISEDAPDVSIKAAATWLEAARLVRRRDRGAMLRNLALPVLAGFLVVALVSGFVAVKAQNDAATAERTLLSRQLAARSEEYVATDPTIASLLAVTAWRVAPTDQARESLLRVVAQPVRAVLDSGGPASGGSAALSISPDGKYLAAAGSRDIRLWNLATRTQVGPPLTSGQGRPLAVAFSPNGKLLATMTGSGECDVRIRDVATGRQIGDTIDGDCGETGAMTFSPDGEILATGDQDVRLWSTATHRQIGSEIRPVAGEVQSLAFSPDGEVLITTGTAMTAGAVQLVDVATHRQIGLPMANPPGPNKLSLSPRGNLIAAASTQGVRLWDMATHRQVGQLASKGGSVTGVTFVPGGNILATVATDGAARLWDVATRRQIGEPLSASTAGGMAALAFSPDGEVLATLSGDGSIRLWDVATFHQRSPSFGMGNHKAIEGTAFDPTGRVLAVAGTGVRLWDPERGRPVGPPVATDSGVNAVAFRRDGSMLATAEADGTARLWDTASHRQIGSAMRTGGVGTKEVAFSRDGAVLGTVAGDGTAQFWDTATRRRLGSTFTAPDGIDTLAFGPDGTIFATGGFDGEVRLWHLATRRQIGPPIRAGGDGVVSTVAFGPDGRILTTASPEGVRLWDVATRRSISPFLTGDGGGVATAVAFSRDGAILATVGPGGVRLWDVATHRQIGPAMTAGPESETVAFGSGDTILASADADGRVRLWDVAIPRDLARAACSIAGRSLTRGEWSAYLPTRPYENVCS